jgi:hypothetical protein
LIDQSIQIDIDKKQSCSPATTTKTKVPTATQSDHSSNSSVSHQLSLEYLHTFAINTKKSERQQTKASLSRTKTQKLSVSTDSILSTLSFDQSCDILTVSRTGCIYYCLEDLYRNVFSSLCTLDELIDLLEKSELFLLKQVTLSEKIALDDHLTKSIPTTDCNRRYRLLSINSSDHLRKLKQLLVNQRTAHCHEQIIHTMRSIKQLSSVIPKKPTGMYKNELMLILCHLFF